MSLRPHGEIQISSIGKQIGLGPDRKVPGRGQKCSVQRNETGADDTKRARHTRASGDDGACMVVGDGMTRKWCTVNSGRSVGRPKEADRSQSIHSSTGVFERRRSEGMQRSETRKGDNDG